MRAVGAASTPGLHCEWVGGLMGLFGRGGVDGGEGVPGRLRSRLLPRRARRLLRGIWEGWWMGPSCWLYSR